jgi:hypothetical protein
MDPFKLLQEAIKAVPALRFALGVAGMAAVVAIVLGFGLNSQAAVFGVVLVLGLMFILVLFSQYAGTVSSTAEPSDKLHSGSQTRSPGEPNPESSNGPPLKNLNRTDLTAVVRMLVWFYASVLMCTTAALVLSSFTGWPLSLIPSAESLTVQVHMDFDKDLDAQTEEQAIDTNLGTGAGATDGQGLVPELEFQEREPDNWWDHYDYWAVGNPPSDHNYKRILSTPGPPPLLGSQSKSIFLARIRRRPWGSKWKGSKEVELCFVRTKRRLSATERWGELRCDEHKGTCAVSKEPESISSCSSQNSEAVASFSVLPRVYAADRQQPDGWTIPSLDTLRKKFDSQKVGYVLFDIKSESLNLSPATDSFTYAITVNGVPAYIDGWLPNEVRKPLEPSKGLDFAFGLENLDFSGPNDGKEAISVSFEFWSKNRVISSTKLSRDYAAMYDAPSARISTQIGNFDWNGVYQVPKHENQYEVIVWSSSAVTEASRIKARIDRAHLVFHHQPVVAVLRPPVLKPTHRALEPQFGVAVGLQQSTRQVQFTFDSTSAINLCSWVNGVRESSTGASLIKSDAYRYEFRSRQYVACSSVPTLR